MIARRVALSPTQYRVLLAYARCRSRKVAAAELAMNPATFRSHLREAYRRLGVEGEGPLAILAACEVQGWLDVPAA